MSCSSWQRWHLHRKSVWTLLDLVQWAILVFLKASFGSSHVERRQCFRKVPGWCHSSFLVLRRWFSTQTSHKGLWPWPIWLPTNILPKEPKILRTARKQDRCQRWQAGWDDSWQPVWGQTQVAALDRDSKPGELVSSHLVWLMIFTFLQPYIIHGHSERMLKLKGFHGQKCSQKWGFLGWQIYPLEAYILKVERSADFGLLSKQMEKAHKSRRQNCA